MPPEARSLLQPNRKYDSGTECCDANLAALVALEENSVSSSLMTRGSVPHTLKGHSELRVVTLKAGDALFIPRYWFHQVETLSEHSLSLNTFASTPLELLLVGTPRWVRHKAHEVCHWRRGHCVCHGEVKQSANSTQSSGHNTFSSRSSASNLLTVLCSIALLIYFVYKLL